MSSVTVSIGQAELTSYALVVDDERGYRETAVSNLTEEGFEVDEAASVDEARSWLDDRRYSLVIFDNIFGDVHAPKAIGSRFLREEWHRTRGARVILASGFAPDQIEEREYLEGIGVKIVGKKRGHMKRIREISRVVRTDEKKRMEEALGQVYETVVRSPRVGPEQLIAGAQIAMKAGEFLRKHLLNLPGQDRQHIYLGGRSFSPAQLVRELDKGGDAGLELVDIYLDDTLGDESF